MSSIAKLLNNPGVPVILKDGRSTLALAWNMDTDSVRCWWTHPKVEEEEIVQVLRSDLRISKDGKYLFEVGHPSEEEGYEDILKACFLDGTEGEIISRHSLYGFRIYTQRNIIHRSLTDFEEREGIFWEVTSSASRQLNDNVRELAILGQCRILMADGQIGQVSEWDLFRNEVAIFVKGSTVRRPVSEVEQAEKGFRYRLRER